MDAEPFGLGQARHSLPPRGIGAHKHKAELLVIAGSQRYLGAGLLCARSAYRSGAGMVRWALPQSLAIPAVAALPEAVIEALVAEDGLDERHLDALLALCGSCHAVVLGPGLGRSPGVQALVRALWRRVTLPMLVDADALHALDLAVMPGGERVLTPHEGELKAMQGPDALEQGRVAAVLALARRSHAVALLKGPGTLSAAPDGRLRINQSGGPVLATAGSGDVLAGLIGALLAQRAETFDAAALGAWLHGRAADLWSERNAGRGLLASDLADLIPIALAEAGA